MSMDLIISFLKTIFLKNMIKVCFVAKRLSGVDGFVVYVRLCVRVQSRVHCVETRG